jgi:hypothetical protein
MGIPIKDGNGNSLTLTSKTINGEECPESCNVPNGSIDRYISKYASDPADSDNEDANKNYSVTPANFVLAPPAGEIWYVSRLLVYIQDTGSFDSGGYGNGVALTNGIQIKVYEGAIEKSVLTNSQPIKQNTHWAKFCYDISISNFGSGDEALGARWTFVNGGTYIRLDGDLSQKIQIELNDDMSILTSQTFLFQGFKEQ